MEFVVDERFVRELRGIQKTDLAGTKIVVNNKQLEIVDLLYPHNDEPVEQPAPPVESHFKEMLVRVLSHDTANIPRDELFCEISGAERRTLDMDGGLLIYGIIEYAGAPKPSQGNARWIKIECVANYKTGYHRSARAEDDIFYWAKQLPTSPYKLESLIGEPIRICGILSKGVWIVPVEEVRLESNSAPRQAPARDAKVHCIEDLL